jgi:superfamily II DNA or RNA helicase
VSAQYGRDRRRRLSPDEARFLYERAGGKCQRCGVALDARWHGAHLTAHVNGGATQVAQMEAWCWQCNLRLGPKDAENAPAFTPRMWQKDALPQLLDAIYHNGVATLHAAPGAGKTFEASWVFKQLFDAGIVRRLLVVVPTTALVGQWVENLGLLGIHLDPTPRNGVFELEGTVGAVVCYAALPGSAGAHAVRMDQIPTLVVWDEVHHLSEKASWGNAARAMVGDVANGGIAHASAVLNITGTLFRSSKTQRIATVRYVTVATDEGEKLQAVADYSVTTSDLINVELRPPDLYVYSGRAQLVDLKTEEVIAGEIADLDKQQRQAVMRESFASKTWLRGFCQEAVTLLRRQLHAINDEEPLKILYIAQSQRAAERAADMLNEVTQQDFSRLVITDQPNALRKLKEAKRLRRSCAIVAVQMVTEGFDCNHIATTAYASNKTAALFVAQAMARNMRVTETERSSRRMLPAQILIPDNPDIRKAFASALANAKHEIAVEDDLCPRCMLSPAACNCPPGPGGSGGGLPRYTLIGLDDPWLRSAVVLGHADGETDGKELNDQWIPVCADLGIPETYAPKVAVASRRVRPKVQVYAQPELTAEEVTPAVRTPANPRDVNLAYRAQITQAAAWMTRHIDHDDSYDTIGAFQTAVNKATGIPFDGKGKGMRDAATGPQLKAAAEWARSEIARHCETRECRAPGWIVGGDDL